MTKQINKITFVLSFLFAGLLPAYGQTAVGQWRVHLSYQGCKTLVEAGELLYAASERGLYTVNTQSLDVEKLTKTEGISDVNIAVMDYNASLQTLLIIYSNTNIDMIKGHDIYNMSDIQRKPILGVKKINSITFDGDFAILGTSFGVVVLDMRKMEVKDSYTNIGPSGSVVNVLDCRIYGDSIYAATEDGILRARYSATVNLSDFNKWSSFVPAGRVDQLEVFNNKLYAEIDSVIQVYQNGAWSFFDGSQKKDTRSIKVNHDKLFITQATGFIAEDASGTRTTYPENQPTDAILDRYGILWFGTSQYGLIRWNTAINQRFYYQPNGPSSYSSYNVMTFDDEVWITAGGVSYNNGPLFNKAGYYWFRDESWSNRKPNPVTDTLPDFTVMAHNTRNGHIFIGTQYDGMVELDADANLVNKFSDNNSTLRRIQNLYCYASGLVYDSKGNLWVTNYGAYNDSALSVYKKDGTWQSFPAISRFLNDIIIDDYNQKWIVSKGNGSNYGLVVYDDNGTIENLNDDNQRLIKDVAGEGGLPTQGVRSITKDKDGQLWLGTEKGVAVIYTPGNVFTGGNYDAQQIKITQDGYTNYLLVNEIVNDIKVDGANRKWIATNSGVWLVAPDGMKILKHFDADNSPLLSNTVNCLGINPTSGEVFFGTSEGIVSYRGDATEGDKVHKNVKVFPNPVRPGYSGVITISGLPENASVKITDINGNMVYETIANGGTATWDGRSFKGHKPASGVYLIFSASEDGSDDYVSKLLIVN